MGLTLVQAPGRDARRQRRGPQRRRRAGAASSSCACRLPAAPAADRRQRAGRAARRPADARRILVVDDNVDVADSLAQLLELPGHEVHVGLRRAEALATARRVPRPRSCFLDIGMPGIDGYEVARRLRAEPTNCAGAVLVAVTGWGQEEDRRRAREAGFDHHLVKPVDARDIEAIIKESVVT